ncbi:hypothetical protein I6B53_05040 [Schaalia sp. 19OD2882]|uniref:hypothetical protein n=1 Tax=Schaalia sp. 19OD2882 TaxID=2794089 RepID=UPI001C1EDE29|nr:hypothetical protein [Schaalia sp. 19OD2882]QWW20440.1 hypothetical protein I6B53_05040 [Schaalia sp. 19OD2882]
MCHLAPDTLAWKGMGADLTGAPDLPQGVALARLAGGGRASAAGSGISVVPFLFTKVDITTASRHPVPLKELHELHCAL